MIINQPTLSMTESSHFRIYDMHIHINKCVGNPTSLLSIFLYINLYILIMIQTRVASQSHTCMENTFVILNTCTQNIHNNVPSAFLLSRDCIWNRDIVITILPKTIYFSSSITKSLRDKYLACKPWWEICSNGEILLYVTLLQFAEIQ